MAEVKAIPDGYRTVTPFLNVDGANEAIAFYKAAFGAEEKVRMPTPAAEDLATAPPPLRHERALEAEIGGLVIEQQPRADAGGQRHAEEQDEDQAIGPVAALEDQDVAKPAVPHQHRRQRGHDREFDDERGQQDLLEPELRAGHDLH